LEILGYMVKQVDWKRLENNTGKYVTGKIETEKY
jgi:hypothetical protein